MGQIPTATRKFATGETAISLNAAPSPPWGTSRFGPTSAILIKVGDLDTSMPLSNKDEFFIGRYDPDNAVTLSLDLTPYGAREQGVSRVHAAIRRGEGTITLVDLNSANGTHLNGQRLSPNQPRVLRDGDEVRLAKLIFRIFFK